METLEYPMAVTSFNISDWENIIRPLINSTLPKMGIPALFPRDLVFASKKCQGLNIHHPFYWQIIIQIIILNKHFGVETITGKLITTKWESLLQSIGLEGETSLWPWEIIDEYASQKSWIGDLIQLAGSINIVISI